MGQSVTMDTVQTMTFLQVLVTLALTYERTILGVSDCDSRTLQLCYGHQYYKWSVG